MDHGFRQTFLEVFRHISLVKEQLGWKKKLGGGSIGDVEGPPKKVLEPKAYFLN